MIPPTVTLSNIYDCKSSCRPSLGLKVQAITQQGVPEPSTYALIGSALIAGGLTSAATGLAEKQEGRTS